MLSLYRMRAQLVKFRTMQSNGLRGLLAELIRMIAESLRRQRM
jgi:transposase